MSRARSSDMLRQVRTLFGVGVVAGLSDAELLERFTVRKFGVRSRSGIAFTASTGSGHQIQCS
jgi:hypothetical protein